MTEYTLPEKLRPNPDYGYRRAYVNTFEIWDWEDVLSGLLGELKALKQEGYEPVHFEVQKNFSDGKFKVMVVVENKEMFLR